MTRSLLLLAAATLTVSSALAQAPAGAPPAGAPPAGAQRPRRPMPPPTNLKVLPKDWTGEQVMGVMHKFESSLGVECEYCHDPVKDPTTGHHNMASDANPVKDKARVMLKMTMAINHDFLTQLTPATDAKVGCGTCHRGNAKPPAFVPPPDEHERHDAPPPAAPTK